MAAWNYSGAAWNSAGEASDWNTVSAWNATDGVTGGSNTVTSSGVLASELSVVSGAVLDLPSPDRDFVHFTVDYSGLDPKSPFAGDSEYAGITANKDGCDYDLVTSPDGHSVSMSGTGVFTLSPVTASQDQTFTCQIYDEATKDLGATITITVAASVAYDATGALASEIATVSGTAKRTVKSNGVLASELATIYGNATDITTSYGALVATDATTAGAVFVTKKASGTFVSLTATLSGVADVVGNRTSSGALASSAASLQGAATRRIKTFGALSAELASLLGTANTFAVFHSSGSLVSEVSSLTGFAGRKITSSGSLVTEYATTFGSANLGGFADSGGALDSAIASLTGTAVISKRTFGGMAASNAGMYGIAAIKTRPPQWTPTTDNLNSNLNIDLGNVPQVKDEDVYEALREIHEAFEILVADYEQHKKDAEEALNSAIAQRPPPSGTGGIVNPGDKVTLIGDITGVGAFDDNGEVTVTTRFNGVGGATAITYCPGFVPSYESANSISFALNVTHVFIQGKKLRIYDGEYKYGTVSNSVYSAGKTIVTVTLENGTLNTSVSEVCIVRGNTSWLPIPASAHGFTAGINHVTSGRVNGVTYWIAVGDSGQLAYSKDAGTTWTQTATGIGNKINCVAYNAADETFVAGCNGGIILVSQDAEQWSAINIRDIYTGTAAGATNNITMVASDHITGFMINIEAAANAATKYILYSDDLFTSVIGSLRLASTSEAKSLEYAGYSNRFLLRRTPNEIAAADYNDTVFTRYSGYRYFSSPQTALKVERPSVSDKCFVSLETGKIALCQNGTTMQEIDAGIGGSKINAIAVSLLLHPLAVAVGDYGKITVSTDSGLSWTPVSNGFGPTSSINWVHYDENDALFIAVSNNGEICRSVNGFN